MLFTNLMIKNKDHKKSVELKIRILDLQENYCRVKESQYCIQDCKIGQELNKLYEKRFKKRSKRRETKEKPWDEKGIK
ncbi:Uncharacterised protein [Bacillus cereus]|nr:Uncharacterised protein [Bacillus cereus]